MKFLSQTEKLEYSRIYQLLNKTLDDEKLKTQKVCLFCLTPIVRSREDYLCGCCRMAVDHYIDGCYEGTIGRKGYVEAAVLNLNAADYYALRKMRRIGRKRKDKFYSFFQLATIIGFNNRKHFKKCNNCGKFYFATGKRGSTCQECRDFFNEPVGIQHNQSDESYCRQCGKLFYETSHKEFCTQKCRDTYYRSTGKSGGVSQ